MKIRYKLAFRLQGIISSLVLSPLRKAWLRFQGLSIGNTNLPRCKFTFPYKVSIGDRCILEDDIYFRHDGSWSSGRSILIGDHVFIGRGCEFNVSRSLKIGDGSLIASGCKFIDHDHGHALLNVPIRSQDTRDGPILIENNVWLGCNTIVLKGVTIGAGAIVGAGAVVTRSIPQNEIWAGAPARFVKQRGFENVCPINERRSS